MIENWPKYIEIKHEQFVEEVKDFYFMIIKLKVSVEGEFDCPAKTIALFAHNEEFSYGKDDILGLSENITFDDVNKCTK